MAETAQGELALAIDLGGTRFRVALVDESGGVVRRGSHPTHAQRGPEQVIAQLQKAALQMLGHARSALRGVGVAAPGPLDPWSGVVFSAPNLADWRDVPLKASIENTLGLHTVVGNDANLAAFGEARHGAGRGYANLVYLTVSTGVGSGVMVDGKLLLGKAGLASEAGHMIVHMDGPTCACGNHGCLESLASGTAIARRARELLDQGQPSTLSVVSVVTAEDVASAAAAGDGLARAVLWDAGRALGVGIMNLVHIFNPEIVILGGGVTRSGKEWWQAVRSTLEQYAMDPFRRGLQVVPAALGDSAGLLGAAAAVFNEAAATGRG